MTCYSTSFPVCAIKYSDRNSLSGKGFFFFLFGWLCFILFFVVVLFCFCLLGAHYGGEVKAVQQSLRQLGTFYPQLETSERGIHSISSLSLSYTVSVGTGQTGTTPSGQVFPHRLP